MLLNLNIQSLPWNFCFFLLLLLFVILSRSLFNVRSCGRCNDAWHYVIRLEDRLCNDFFKLKHLYLLSLHLVDNIGKNIDELGSEHHVRTHINDPPCFPLLINWPTPPIPPSFYRENQWKPLKKSQKIAFQVNASMLTLPLKSFLLI